MRNKLSLFAFSLALSAALTIFYLEIKSDYCTWDLLAFWASAKQFFSGRNPYLIGDYTPELHPPYCAEVCKYAVVEPPTGLVLSFPFYFFNFKEAIAAYLFFANLSFLFVIFYSNRLLVNLRSNREKIFGLLPILTFTPLLFSLYIGQIAIFITLALVLFYYHFAKGRYFLSGIFLSLTLSKPHLLYLLYFFLFLKAVRSKSHRNVAIGFVTGTAGLCVIALIVNPYIFLMNLDALLHIYKPEWLTPTIGSWLNEFDPVFRKSWIAPMLLGVFMAWKISVKSKFSEFQTVMTMALWSMATTPYIWTYDFPIYLPTLVLLGNSLFVHPPSRTENTKLVLVLLAMNVLLVVNRFRWEYDVWYPWLILVVWYAALSEHSIFNNSLKNINSEG